MGVKGLLPKPKKQLSLSPKHGGPLHQISLESDASKMFPLSTERIHSKVRLLSRHVRAHTYIKNTRGGLWYPYLIGSMGVSTFPNPNKLSC